VKSTPIFANPLVNDAASDTVMLPVTLARFAVVADPPLVAGLEPLLQPAAITPIMTTTETQSFVRLHTAASDDVAVTGPAAPR
jgi:hypothetical protein